MHKTALLLLALATAVFAAHHGTWQSHNDGEGYFAAWDRSSIQRLLGVKRTGRSSTLKKAVVPKVDLPVSFDSRTQWPNCIGGILDQGRCGSCWAFGAATAFSDRACISNSSGQYKLFAPLDLVINDNNDGGCQGGNLDSAFEFIQRKGLVTEACLPYLTSEGGPIKTCLNTSQPCMPDTFVPTPNPSEQCKNGATYSTDKTKARSINSVSGEQDMMAQLVANGPFEVAFDVYADFVNYKSGVYIRQSSDMLGGHAVRVIAYGVENGVNYWLVANSWTTVWGDQGYFKIRRGTDECGIEDEAAFGQP